MVNQNKLDQNNFLKPNTEKQCSILCKAFVLVQLRKLNTLFSFVVAHISTTSLMFEYFHNCKFKFFMLETLKFVFERQTLILQSLTLLHKIYLMICSSSHRLYAQKHRSVQQVKILTWIKVVTAKLQTFVELTKNNSTYASFLYKL